MYVHIKSKGKNKFSIPQYPLYNQHTMSRLVTASVSTRSFRIRAVKLNNV